MKLADDLGIAVVAEGVETEAQFAKLRAEGCGYLQGYLFGKPLPFVQATADLAVRNLKDVMLNLLAAPAVLPYQKRA